MDQSTRVRDLFDLGRKEKQKEVMAEFAKLFGQRNIPMQPKTLVLALVDSGVLSTRWVPFRNG